MRYFFITIFLLISFLCIVVAQSKTDFWEEAAQNINRISADNFQDLPASIKGYLNLNKYQIPQTYISKKYHNVIHGEFIKKNQKDWAVLASKNLKSHILIFKNGKTDSSSIIFLRPVDDKNYLQGISNTEIGYSRYISVVDSSKIIEYHKSFGGQESPTMSHQGINDAFCEKGSEILYYYKNKWLSLTGAD